MLLTDKLQGRKLILASHSPRRRELIAGVGLPFELADGYEVEEVYPDSLPLHGVPVYLAALKSAGYPEPLASNEILITADTVVVCEGEILGKPDGVEGAKKMLRKLSGKRHTVVSGVMIRSASKADKFSATTDVWFRELRDEEIEYYINKYKPFDKAGSYGIQEWIGYAAIEKVDGSFYNVMGLPIQTLYVRLEKFLDEV